MAQIVDYSLQLELRNTFEFTSILRKFIKDISIFHPCNNFTTIQKEMKDGAWFVQKSKQNFKKKLKTDQDNGTPAIRLLSKN